MVESNESVGDQVSEWLTGQVNEWLTGQVNEWLTGQVGEWLTKPITPEDLADAISNSITCTHIAHST